MKRSCVFALCFVLLFISFMAFAGAEEEKPSVKAYGYIKLDDLYETGHSSHGNYAMWAMNPGETNGKFYVTAKETRLGLAITGFSFGKFKVTGKIEVDFHSNYEAENKAYNYMRHAYLQISDGSLTITAGQTWDIINPLNPVTLNYSVLWCAGNIGYRRPQLSFRKDFKAGKNLVTLEAGIFRTISADYDMDGVDDGVSSGLPTIQGRIAGKLNVGNQAFLQLGVSGHYGKIDTFWFTRHYKTISNSLNADFLLVLSPKFKILAEYFSGKNLSPYLGGIAQSPSLENVAGGSIQFIDINSRGFFVNVVANPIKKVRLSTGLGIDDPFYKDSDYPLDSGFMTKNTSIFGNLVISLSRSVEVGLEISHWKTDKWYNSRIVTYKTTRFQNSWILYF